MSRGLGETQKRVLVEAAEAWRSACISTYLSQCWVQPWRLRYKESLAEYRAKVESERRAVRRLVQSGWLVTASARGPVSYGGLRPPVGEPTAAEDWDRATTYRMLKHYSMSAAERLPAEATAWPESAIERFEAFLRQWIGMLPAQGDDRPDGKSAEWVERQTVVPRSMSQFAMARQQKAKIELGIQQRSLRRDAVLSLEQDFKSKLLWDWNRRVPNLPWECAWARWSLRELRLARTSTL